MKESFDSLFLAVKRADGSVKFIHLPYRSKVLGIFTESHLKSCWAALVENGLVGESGKIGSDIEIKVFD